MKYEHFRNQVAGIVQEICDIDSNTLIGSDNHLVIDLHMDVHDLVELIQECELKFNIVVDESWDNIKTFGELCTYIYNRINK